MPALCKNCEFIENEACNCKKPSDKENGINANDPLDSLYNETLPSCIGTSIFMSPLSDPTCSD